MAVLNITDKDDVVVVGFTHSRILDETAIRAIGQEFNDLTLQAASGKKLVLNFNRVEFMSSAMIGQIMKLNTQCKNDKIKLKLCNISPKIMEVFTIMRLDKVLDLHADEADALAGFGSSKRGWFARS